MSEALEQRMTAMRARLSHLSTAVDKKDEERSQGRCTAHRYYRDAPPSSSMTGAPTTPYLSTPQAALKERDVNIPVRLSAKDVAPSKQNLHADASSPNVFAPTTAERAAGSPQIRGVDAMLQLARQYASAPSGTRHRDTSSTFSAHSQASAPVAAGDALFSPAASQPDFAGLRTYEFQERFPLPRRTTATATDTTGVAVEETSSRQRTPRDAQNGHRYVEGNVPARTSADASFTSVSSSALNTAATSEVHFDAFRVVQERLRQKMRQLTNAPPTTLRTTAEPTSKASGLTTNDSLGDSAHPHTENSYQEGDSSPPPRPPPGPRAATATPLRSPEKRGDTTLEPPSSARSPHSYRHERPITHIRTPIEVELSGAQSSKTHAGVRLRQTLYDPVSSGDESERSLHPREYTYDEHVPSPASSRSVASAARFPKSIEHRGVEVALTERSMKPLISTSPGAFSDPTSATRQQKPSGEAPLVANPRIGRDGPRGLPRSLRTVSRSPSGPTTHKRKPLTGSRSEQPDGGSRILRRSASTAPSPSHPRERSSTGSQPLRPSASEPRTKPISLNVEATVLASVTGAELFALLRMRRLIDSEGDTEEYRLPPTRCHRLYVTADEHRQLQLLRQSIHAMEDEQKEMPSYQRPTVAARSRNAEFALPPPVTHFMGR